MPSSLNISFFEKLWLSIEPAITSNTATFWQNVYKEIYINLIKNNRWELYLKGLGTTLEVSFLAIILGTILGLTLALLRTQNTRELKFEFGDSPISKIVSTISTMMVRLLTKIADIYVQLFRGTPLLLQLLIINFGVFGTIRLDKVIIGVIACGMNSAAYVAEIIRGGIQSVPQGQTEAGRSLGLSALQTMWQIVLPQAFKATLPALCNEFISLIKETSILSYIALTELTKASDYIRSRTYSAFTPYIISGLLYLIVIISLTKLIGILEKRLRQGDLY